MNLRSVVNRILGREEPRTLRNKPDSMAWVRVANDWKLEFIGLNALHMAPVKVVRFNGSGWDTSPDLEFVVRNAFQYRDKFFKAGDTAKVTGFEDQYLEPWRDIGDNEKDESHRYLPNVLAPRVIPVVFDL